tara:strand:+ start:86 stop:466 length:381 start_codon:yes stop_codon:yes gene_type:complete
MGGTMDIIKGGYQVGKGLVKLSSGAVISSPIWNTIRNMYFNKKNPKKEIAKAVDLSLKDVGDVIKMTGLNKGEPEGFLKKNMGGMAHARKKNMGLKYKKGGSVKSSSKKSRGTGAAIKGTKFKGVF